MNFWVQLGGGGGGGKKVCIQGVLLLTMAIQLNNFLLSGISKASKISNKSKSQIKPTIVIYIAVLHEHCLWLLRQLSWLTD